MNDKLVRRAATKFHNWLKSLVEDPASMSRDIILQELSGAIGKIHEAEKWASRFLDGMKPREQFVIDSLDFVEIGPYRKTKHFGIVSPKVYNDISTKMIPNIFNSASHSMKKAARMLKNISDEPPNPSLSLTEAMQEMTIVNDSWPKVEYQKGLLAVTIDEVSLSDDNDTVHFGKFLITLDLSDPFSKHGLGVGAISPKSEEGDHYHPHVTPDGSLCAGDGEDMMKEALIQGRLEDYFRIVEAILRTYNVKSPYASLSNWYNPDHEGETFCDACETYRPDEEAYHCESCNTSTCDICGSDMSECSECNEYRCSGCYNCCEGCGETVCHSCSINCTNCKCIYCSSCLVECCCCSNKSCEECLNSCTKCGESTCDSCKEECSYCGDTFCSECLDMECDDCNQGMCPDCQVQCEDCTKVICKGCENSCEHCGVAICLSCNKEHDCLLAEVSS